MFEQRDVPILQVMEMILFGIQFTSYRLDQIGIRIIKFRHPGLIEVPKALELELSFSFDLLLEDLTNYRFYINKQMNKTWFLNISIDGGICGDTAKILSDIL